MIVLRDRNKVDERHTVAINNSISFATAIQVNKDGSYESVMYMTDDCRTYDNEAFIDATAEELETYRKHINNFAIGDTIKIVSGRKMKGEIKKIKNMFRFTVPNTYGKQYTDYLVFEDGTKVNRLNCVII